MKRPPKISSLLAKEAIWVAAGQLASAAGALVLVRVLTGYLTPEEYGRLSLSLTAVVLVNQVVMGGLNNGLARFYPIAVESNDLNHYVTAAARMTLAAIAISLVFAAIVTFGLRAANLHNWIPLALLAFFFAIVSGVNAILVSIHNVARRRKMVAIITASDAGLKIALSLLFMRVFGTETIAVLIGFLGSSAALIILQKIYFSSDRIFLSIMQPGASRMIGRIWEYSWPFSAWGTFSWAQQVSDRWALQTFSSTSEVGIYSVLYQVGYTPMVLFTGMAITFLSPMMYQQSGDGTNNERNKAVQRNFGGIGRIFLACTMFCFFALFVLREPVFSLLTSQNYHSGSEYLPWIALSAGMFGTGQVFALKLMSDLKSTAMISIIIGTSCFGIAVNVLGAAFLGLQGVVLASVIYSTSYVVCMYRVAMKTIARVA